MAKTSEAILSLTPVTFRYERELDTVRISQFGLVAEDVEKVAPHLVTRDEQGRFYTVRYEGVNAMLLNEFLKEHHTVQDSATLSTNPISNDWNTAGNWIPNTVPNGSGDIATFGPSRHTAVLVSTDTEVSEVIFNTGASSFTINAADD
jgi:endosialidase-like protein